MRFLLVMALVSAGCGNADESPCNARDLERALAAAGAGDTVEVGACRIEGSFTVPDGVTLVGAGTERTTIAVSSGTGLELAGSAEVAELSVVGNVTRTSAGSIPPTPDGTTTALIGIHAESAGDVVLRDVSVRGFARFGALFVGADVTWTGGAASDNLGTAVMFSGGSADLGDLEICGTMRGLRLAAYGLVIADGAMALTRDVQVCDGEAFGVLHHGGTGMHQDLVVTGNGEPGFWVQENANVSIIGAGSLFAGNALAGLYAVGTPTVRVSDARIEGSTLATRVGPGGTEMIEVGDGAQLVLDDGATIAFRNTTFAGNARVGLLVDVRGDGLPAGVTFDSVTVESSGTANGAILQNASGPIAPGTWDGGITRSGSATALDPSVADRFAVLGAVAPMF